MGSYESFRDVPTWARWSGMLRRVPGLGSMWPTVARQLAPAKPKLRGLLRHGGNLPGAYFLRRGALPAPRAARPDRAGARRRGLAAYSPVADAEESLAAVVTNGEGLDPWLTVHILESTQYMRNQLLRDSDWASMAPLSRAAGPARRRVAAGAAGVVRLRARTQPG